MYKSLLGVIVGICSFAALAVPDRIDVLGLVPGVSDVTQLRQVAADPMADDRTLIFLEIGGHNLPCMFKLLDGKLSVLGCTTGSSGSANKLKEYTKASNIEVHGDLKKGFTTKLGTPDSVEARPVRTALGGQYVTESVVWIDKLGNKLFLISRSETINAGMLFVESAARQKADAEEKAAIEARKKF